MLNNEQESIRKQIEEVKCLIERVKLAHFCIENELQNTCKKLLEISPRIKQMYYNGEPVLERASFDENISFEYQEIIKFNDNKFSENLSQLNLDLKDLNIWLNCLKEIQKSLFSKFCFKEELSYIDNPKYDEVFDEPIYPNQNEDPKVFKFRLNNKKQLS